MTRTKIILSSTAVVALVTGTVAADGVRYAQFSYDRNNYSVGDDDINANELVGEIEYQVGDVLLSGAVENLSADRGDLDATTREISVGAGYFLSPDILIGAEIGNVETDTADATVAGAFAQYRTDQFGVGLSIRQDLDAEETLYLGVATFEVSPGIDLGIGLSSNTANDSTGYVISADYEQGPIDARVYFAGNSEDDASTIGARGAYEFGSAFRGTAAFENVSGGLVDYTSFKIGAGYEIADGAWIDASIGQIDPSNGETVDTLSLSISFETGGPTRLDREFARDLRGDANAGSGQFRNALGALPIATP
ncbi:MULTISPECIES: porin [unclassified Yoonia]|uniref:porin n=1 Tax=unclassified Yoonia TaxID=2629118 RepID=UPI0037294A57